MEGGDNIATEVVLGVEGEGEGRIDVMRGVSWGGG